MPLFLDRDTWVHRLHPLVRLFGMLVLFLAAYLVEGPLWQLPLLLALGALLAASGAWRTSSACACCSAWSSS